MSKKKPETTANNSDFESLITELSSICEYLDKGSLTLEESLDAFERGIQLTLMCQDMLRCVDQRIEKVLVENTKKKDYIEH